MPNHQGGYSDAQVILVDFDVGSAHEDDVVTFSAYTRTERAFVDQFAPLPLEALAGTDFAFAIDAAASRRFEHSRPPLN
jgi:hypothetical protein